jgi:hypothetical protein
MSEELTFYELEVLGWHRSQPRKESDERDRKETQNMLAGLHYLTRSEQGVFSITTKGLKRLGGRN